MACQTTGGYDRQVPPLKPLPLPTVNLSDLYGDPRLVNGNQKVQ